MAGNKFTVDVSAWVEKAKGKADIVLRKSAIDLFSRVIRRSPVDTGRFRNNWNVSIGAPASGITLEVDPSGSAALVKINETVADAKMGDTIFLVNALPYSVRLENGWSKQAPAGMVGVSVLEWQSIVNKATNETKD